MLTIALTIWLCITADSPTYAQSSALVPPQRVAGALESGETDRYTFSAPAGAVMSFSARAEDTSFDPVLTLVDSQGRVILTDDDYAYPASRDALLEAVTLPRTDTYTLIVSGYNSTAGAYSLSATPGYSELSVQESFDTSDRWESDSGSLSSVIRNDRLELTYNGERGQGSAFPSSIDSAADFYAQIRVIGVSNPSGWRVGLAFRRQRDDAYNLVINDDGQWRFALMQSGVETVLRDWTPHPAIVPGAQSFTVGMMANGSGFDFYYNGAYIGSESDATLTAPGAVGVSVGAGSSLTSSTTAQIDDMLITTPRLVDGARVIPQQLMVTSPAEMERALELRHVVQSSGVMTLNVPSTLVEFARPGINRLMIGRGTTYLNFALGATVQIESGAPNSLAGCGLIARHTAEDDYILAFLDQSGGYGMSRRDGDTFLPGIYGENAAWGEDEHHLLVIADATTLYYYIDGDWVGTLENADAQLGEVGTAVVNFEAVTTTCRFSNIWLWRWD